jgi:hypothetical protein
LKEILVEIDEDGKVTVKTQGYRGHSCLDALKGLVARLKTLGIEPEIERQTPTAEYYQSQTAEEKVRLQA